jgi:hypothetical protein
MSNAVNVEKKSKRIQIATFSLLCRLFSLAKENKRRKRGEF